MVNNLNSSVENDIELLLYILNYLRSTPNCNDNCAFCYFFYLTFITTPILRALAAAWNSSHIIYCICFFSKEIFNQNRFRSYKFDRILSIINTITFIYVLTLLKNLFVNLKLAFSKKCYSFAVYVIIGLFGLASAMSMYNCVKALLILIPCPFLKQR